MSHTHLWLDTVAGLKTQGWKSVGGNFTSFVILRKQGDTIKVFLHDPKKIQERDTNFIVVRYS